MLASLATIMKEKTALVTSMVYFALTMRMGFILKMDLLTMVMKRNVWLDITTYINFAEVVIVCACF